MQSPEPVTARGRPCGLTVMLPHDAAPEGLAATVEGRAPESLPEPVRQRKIIHIDMDAFYPSAEQRDNPELRGGLD